LEYKLLVNAREERPDTLQAAVVNYLSGFVKPVVSSRIVIRMDLVHLCWKSLDSKYINANLHVLLCQYFCWLSYLWRALVGTVRDFRVP
jgi:hypothetical protein